MDKIISVENDLEKYGQPFTQFQKKKISCYRWIGCFIKWIKQSQKDGYIYLENMEKKISWPNNNG